MADTGQKRRSRRPIRSERDRAVALGGILALVILAYGVVVFWGGVGTRSDPTVVAALTSFVSIGIAVLVTTFSFVFVALSLVSAQFSPRVVRHFWHGDRFRYIFLWSSIAVFGFCFCVQFFDVPRLHILGLFFGAYQIFVLFPVFLGYLADNMNAASITRSIANRTVSEITAHYEPHPSADTIEPEKGVVKANSSGFLQRIDTDRLIAVFVRLQASEPGLKLKISNYLGSFIEVGSTLVSFEPPVDVSDTDASEIVRSFSIYKFRSYEQDIEYGIRQLVDIAVKAISPAVNDPTTCVNCIHYLGVILKELAVKADRSSMAAKLEAIGIILKEPNFEQYLDDAFDQIYQFGRRDHTIVRTLIGVLTEIMSAVPDTARAETVVKEVSEMELDFLTGERRESLFALAEHRNYVRKSLIRFYAIGGERFESFGNAHGAAELRKRAAELELSIEGPKG